MIRPSGALLRVGYVAMALQCGIAGADLGAQTVEVESRQWLFASTKVSYAVGKWRVYGDVQFRLKGDWRELDQYLLEVASPYSPNKNWELQPDLRITVKPALIEYRAGAGVTLKALASNWQFAAQHKYQLDLESTGATKHGVRQIFFVNNRIADRLVLSVLGGWFYRWRDGFSGIEFVRVGGGATYVFDALHGLNVSYFVGRQNLNGNWVTDGFAFIGLTINVRADWLYVPAFRIVDF